LEGRHDGVQLPFEVTLGELREVVEGSFRSHIIFIPRFDRAVQKLEDA